MSLHQLRFNKKNNISFKKPKKEVLPPTCDTIVRNLINSPRHHLGLIDNKNVTYLFKDSNNLPQSKRLKLKKLGNLLTKDFSVEIQQEITSWKPSQLVDFLNKIDSLSANVDGFYIMQPIIVNLGEFNNHTRETEWTLLKGQQRVTSIYMILKYLGSNKFGTEACRSSTDLLNNYFLNVLHYQNWDRFLTKTPGDNTFLNDKLSDIYQTLHNWFSKKTVVEQEIWKKKLLNHTKFIWYVAEDDTSYQSEKVLKTGGVGIEAKYLS